MFPYVPEMEKISTQLPLRQELPSLWDEIEGEMASRGAKFNTLCPIRAEMHRMLFDELIRQIVVILPQQGKMI